MRTPNHPCHRPGAVAEDGHEGIPMKKRSRVSDRQGLREKHNLHQGNGVVVIGADHHAHLAVHWHRSPILEAKRSREISVTASSNSIGDWYQIFHMRMFTDHFRHSPCCSDAPGWAQGGGDEGIQCYFLSILHSASDNGRLQNGVRPIRTADVIHRVIEELRRIRTRHGCYATQREGEGGGAWNRYSRISGKSKLHEQTQK